MVNGKTAEAELNTRRAADLRHPPFITTFTLPEPHAAWPEGMLMNAGENPGEARAAATGDIECLVGVLDTRVAENEESGGVIIHGSCPADILKCEGPGGAVIAAGADQIAALRGIGVYV